MNENVALSGPVKRKLKRKFVRALNKMKSFEEKIIMRDKVNQVIGSSPTKLWYEIITNVPNGTEEVIFDLNLTKEGLQVVYKQDSFGPTFETFTQNSINDDIIQDGKLTLIDKKNSSSVYGSGFVTIGQYSTKVILTSNDKDGDSWSFDFLSGEFNEVGPLKDCNFQIELLIPYNTKMGGWKNYLTQLRDIIQEVDSKNILKGRKYKFSVNGFGTDTDNLEFSKTILPKDVSWVDEAGNPTPTCKYTSFKGKNGNKVIVTSPSCNDDEASITFEIKSIGKVDSSYKLSGFSGDKPMLVVYYKGTNQICFMVPVRPGNGQTSLNNLLIEAEVDKKEIGLFLQSTDKSTGVTPLLKTKLVDVFNNLLLGLYPDSKLVELMIQLFGVDMIVNDESVLGDTFRSSIGLSEMNKLDVSVRKEITKMEVSKDSGRYDIIVNMIWETDMELNSDTPKFIGEVKKTNFGRNDRNQVFCYSLKDKLVTKAVGISYNISSSAIDAYNKDIDSIKRADSLPNTTFYPLLDVRKYNFDKPEIYDYWQREAKKVSDKDSN